DQRHRGGDPAEQLLVRCRRRRLMRSRRRERRRRNRSRVAVAVCGRAGEKSHEAGLPPEENLGFAFEKVTPFLRNGTRVVEVLLEEQRRIAGVQAVDIGTIHSASCWSSGAGATRAGGSCG